MNDQEAIIPASFSRPRKALDELDTMRRMDELLSAQEQEARPRILKWLASKQHSMATNVITESMRKMAEPVFRINHDEDDGA